MLQHSECHDITLVLGREAPIYPGDPVFARTCPDGMSEAMHLVMGAHNGTHLDAPAHFVPGGQTLDDFGPGYFIRPALVAEIGDPRQVTADELAALRLCPGQALLLRTRNSRDGIVSSGVWTPDFVALAPDAAAWCVAHGVPLLGHDYITVDPYGDAEAPAHRALLGAGIPILEGINLAAVEPGEYHLVCLSLRLDAAAGAPARALLLR